MGGVKEAALCYHCGDSCVQGSIQVEEKHFCCKGCQTVYEILSAQGLENYYKIQQRAGSQPTENLSKFDYLSEPEIVKELLEFDDGGLQRVRLRIPGMHCSSCIWVLENLSKLSPSVRYAQVDFPKKSLVVTYSTETFTLKDLVRLLARIGYEPYISLESLGEQKKQVDRSLWYELGVAGFAFGNVMLLSFPEYFEVEEFWLDQYKPYFRGLMLVFSLPVVFFAARSYFKSAYNGLRSRMLNIDVPIALGISALFLRSVADVLLNQGPGFFDSLTGLVFFLLLGRFFQQKTYSYLSFERDYTSYFPIAVTRITEGGEEENVPVNQIVAGDHILIRNNELIPIDGVLHQGTASLDYSFVTGESDPVVKEAGELVFAGGRQLSGLFVMEALKSVSQSHLTQLWGNAVFAKDKASAFQQLTDRISKHFTLGVLTIAFAAAAYWTLVSGWGMGLNVLTAVLIIACPCALALAAPFTWGNVLRILGRRGFYVKNTNTLERMAKLNHLVFDKTGTLTVQNKHRVTYQGEDLNTAEERLLNSTLRASNHPLSRSLYTLLKSNGIVPLDEFEEEVGKGLLAKAEGRGLRVGSAQFVGLEEGGDFQQTAVHVATDEGYKGRYVFENHYREGLSALFEALEKDYSLSLLSGDRLGERKKLRTLLPSKMSLHFNQKPEQKLAFIELLQRQDKKVMMVGDGLNDAGAFAQSDVGVAVAENVNVFSPACDAILDADQLTSMSGFLGLTKQGMKVIRRSFFFSLLYNVIGLYFAVTGQLEPVIAAILMPLSSISVVVFATLSTNYYGRKIKS